MNPISLSQALECLWFLKDCEWIDISSIDIWLMHVWESLPLPEARYIPSVFIPPIMATENQDPAELDLEIDGFRNLFTDLPERGTACPVETLVYVLNCGPSSKQSGNHFCVVVFAPSLGAIYLLGKHIHALRSNINSKDWDSWNGTQIWARVCLLMGWEDLGPMVLCTVNWQQNGYDCGPIACQVAQHIILGGLKTEGTGQWKRPALLACCHTLRLKMADLVHQTVIDGSRNYGLVRFQSHAALLAIYDSGLDGMDDAHQVLQETLNDSPIAGLLSVARNLRQAIQKCTSCHATVEEGRHRFAADPIPLPKEDIMQAATRHRLETLKGTQSMADHVAGRQVDYEETDDVGPTLEEIRVGQDLEEELRSPHSNSLVKIRSLDRQQARIGRFPRPIEPPSLPSRPHLRGLLLPFDPKFDDYEGGPTLEELAPIPETHLQLQPSLMYICKQIMLTAAPYSKFKDYGYRLLPSFAQAFNLGKPFRIEDHLCPVGLASPPTSITDYMSLERKGRFGERITVNDLVVVGAEGLLEIAEEEGDDGILLNGRTIKGDYICVDLLMDHVEPRHLDFSCDLDSLIWITRSPKFTGPVAIYSLPVIRERAPIWKSNHIQVQLLYPQTEDDKLAIGGRSEWVVNMHSLSSLPHLLFGVLQGSSSVAQILLFFPRMKHKDRHFSVNKIPKGIQDFFWDHVVLPSLKLVTPSTRSAYLPFDRFHSSFKMGSGKTSSTFTLDQKQMEKLIKRMKSIIRQVLHLI